MTGEERCWICHRTLSEVSEILSVESDKQKELRIKLSDVDNSKKSFLEKTNLWIKESPSMFDQFDYDFIMENPKQFAGTPFILELESDGLALVKAVTECRYYAGRFDMFGMGEIDDDSNGHAAREKILKMISEFEKSANRKWVCHSKVISNKLFREEYLNDYNMYLKGHLTNFQELKFKEGILFLQKIGMLFYEVQKELLLSNLSTLASEKQKGELLRVKLENFDHEVEICNTCDALISRYDA